MNTGLMPWSREICAHWIIVSTMATLYTAYIAAASQSP